MTLPLHPDQYRMVRERACWEVLQLVPNRHPIQYMAYAYGVEDAAQVLKVKHNEWEREEDERQWAKLMAL